MPCKAHFSLAVLPVQYPAGGFEGALHIKYDYLLPNTIEEREVD